MRVVLIGWFLKTKIVSYLLLTNSGHCSWLGNLAKEQCFPFLNMKRSAFNSQSPLLYFPQPNLQETVRDWPDLYLWRYAFQLVLLFKWFKSQNLWQKSILNCWSIIIYWKKSDYRIFRVSWQSQYSYRTKSSTGYSFVCTECLFTLSLIPENRNVLSWEHLPLQHWSLRPAHTELALLLSSRQSRLTWPTGHRAKPPLYLQGTRDPRASTRQAWHLNFNPNYGRLSQVCALDLWADIFCCASHTLTFS